MDGKMQQPPVVIAGGRLICVVSVQTNRRYFVKTQVTATCYDAVYFKGKSFSYEWLRGYVVIPTLLKVMNLIRA